MLFVGFFETMPSMGTMLTQNLNSINTSVLLYTLQMALFSNNIVTVIVVNRLITTFFLNILTRCLIFRSLNYQNQLSLKIIIRRTPELKRHG